MSCLSKVKLPSNIELFLTFTFRSVHKRLFIQSVYRPICNFYKNKYAQKAYVLW